MDNPYFKFNIKLDNVSYNDEEYKLLLQSDSWSRAETDTLMILCYKYDLRWPVIVDRYNHQPNKPLEELQDRFYSIILKLRQHRVLNNNLDHGALKSDQNVIFHLEQEKTRRSQLEILYRK
jgi:DNA methyltransferase 1-associated protein 1